MEQNRLSRLLRKVRTVQSFALALQLVVLLLSAVLFRKITIGIHEQYLWTTPVFVWIVAGSVWLFLFIRSLAWFTSHTQKVNAFELDRLYGLKERLTTFVEFQESRHPFLEPLIRETSTKLSDVSVFRASRITGAMLPYLAMFLLLLTGLWFLPYLPVPESVLARKAEQQQIAEKGKELENLIRNLEKKRGLTPEVKKLSQELKQIAKDLQKPAIEKAEVFKKLNQMEEKQRKLDSAIQQKLTEDLKKSLQEATQPDGKEKELTAMEKQDLQDLAKDFQGAMEGKEPTGGMEKNWKSEQFSSQDLKNLKKALKEFQEQKTQTEQMRAELQKSLDGARKTAGSGKRAHTTDSRLSDREVEQGKGGVEDGPGTTNQDAGPSHFDTTKKEKQEYVEDRTKAGYEQKYDGQREDVGSDPLYLQSEWNKEGDPQYTRVRNFGLDKNVDTTGQATQPGAQNQNESAVRKERIPSSHKDIVKKYFEIIE
jgi:hypothetical protein